MTPILGRVDNDKILCAHKVPFTTLLSAHRAQLKHSLCSIQSAREQAGSRHRRDVWGREQEEARHPHAGLKPEEGAGKETGLGEETWTTA